jgi:UDP-3-O-[3-hydroxymyristoyl] glucosamine N-acyltransferase
MELTVAEIAEKLEVTFEGDGSCAISGIAGIRDARSGDITFVANRRYASEVSKTQASVVVVGKDWDRPCPCALIRVDNPDRAFAKVAAWFAPPPIAYKSGVHKTAIVSEEAQVGDDVFIGPYCVIEPGAVIGDRTILSAGCYVGHDTTLGADCKCYPQVTFRERCVVGDRVIIHNGTVVGSDGFGYTVDGEGVRTKIPQIGRVVIEDDVEIGANVTIDRARFGATRIGRGAKIDNLVQIAHNVVIGEHAVIVAQVGIAGSTMIENRAILAGQAGVAGHLVVGAGAIVGAQAGVTKNVPAKQFVSGYPAAPHDKASRIHAHLMRLPDMREQVAALEERVGKLEKGK